MENSPLGLYGAFNDPARFIQENAAATARRSGIGKRPDAPREVRLAGGSLEVTITWKAPADRRGVSGYRIYQDTENFPIATIRDGALTTFTTKVPADTNIAFYVSSLNEGGKESPKVQVIGKANTDQLVTTGTTGATPGVQAEVPPEYEPEVFNGYDGLDPYGY